MHAVRRSPDLRRLVIATGLACLALLLAARLAAAAEPERKNCPDGFVWIRMSGTACVQEKVPPNGKIGYDGHAICYDPYVGIYEFRPTTDGKSPPGAPYTAFSYLLECVTPEEKARRVAASQGQLNQAALAQFMAENLVRYPSTTEIVILGVTAAGTVLAAAGAIKVGNPGGRVTAPPVPSGPAALGPTLTSAAPSDAAGATAPAEKPPEEPVIPGLDESLPPDTSAERRAEIIREIEADPLYRDLVARDAGIRQLIERIASETDPSKWSLADALEVGGDLAAVLSLIPGLSLPAGVISLIGTIGSATAGQYSTEQIDEARRTLVEELSILRGRIASERDAVVKEHATGVDAHPPQEPSRTPGEEEARRAERREQDGASLRGLSDDDLNAERQRRTDAAVRALEGLHEAERDVADLARTKRDVDLRHDVLSEWIRAMREGRGQASLTVPAVSATTGTGALELASGDASSGAELAGRMSGEASAAWEWIKAAGKDLELEPAKQARLLPATAGEAAQAGLGGISAAANVSSLADWKLDRATEAELGDVHAIKSRTDFVRGRVAADLERAIERQEAARRTYEAATFDRRTSSDEYYRRVGEREARR
ncbi:MAG: hypothetical protein H6Q36_320 [Chloroflexi bacterium]|nr:hypothetical protein [Chloroflexota bacterium]